MFVALALTPGTSSIDLTYIYKINSSNHENIALMVASMTARSKKERFVSLCRGNAVIL